MVNKLSQIINDFLISPIRSFCNFLISSAKPICDFLISGVKSSCNFIFRLNFLNFIVSLLVLVVTISINSSANKLTLSRNEIESSQLRIVSEGQKRDERFNENERRTKLAEILYSSEKHYPSRIVAEALVEFVGLEFVRNKRHREEGISWDNSNLPATKFSPKDANLREVTLNGIQLKYVRFENVDFTSASMKQTLFVESYMSNSIFDKADLSNSVIKNTNLSQGSFRNANLKNVIFDYSEFRGTIFDGADMTNASLLGVNLSGASLKKVKGLKQAQLDRGAFGDDKTQLPKGLKIKR